MTLILYLLTGLLAGILAGLFGVGGGIVLVPSLIWFFGLTQHQAQGLSLAALVLPVGILGALAYYRAHPFDLKNALWIAVGIFIGTAISSYFAQHIPASRLRVAFGFLMILAGLKLIFQR